jgi:hypothetical protein
VEAKQLSGEAPPLFESFSACCLERSHWHVATELSTSPPLPLPSQISHFLQYAESKLGVRNASMYEQDLNFHDIGPDILSEIEDKTLAGIGITTGDIIRLKRGSFVWWEWPQSEVETE